MQSQYNFFKNKVTREIRRAKKNYFKFIFNKYRNDARKTWQTIRDILSLTTNKSTIKRIVRGNVECLDELEISMIFNEYFNKVPLELNEAIPHSDIDPLSFIARNPSSMFLYPASIQECSDIIKSLKRTRCNVDHLPVDIFCNLSEIFAPIVAEIANECFIQGVFPDSLKIACITPIYKKGDPSLVCNYRPISVIHYFGKIIEKLILTRISSFLDKYSIISDEQFGFRSGRSTACAVVRLLDFFYDSLDRGDFSAAIFVDYQRAFDTVPHSILLKKLEAYGVRGNSLSIFQSYLTNRYHFTSINGNNSQKLLLSIGLPQGTLLAPILFNLFINDVCNISNTMSVLLYADDTTLLFRSSCAETLTHTCNEELKKFREWTIANRLSLNADKSFTFFVSNRQANYDTLYFGQTPLEVKSECKFLGVNLDNKLKFSNHLKFLTSKLSKSAGIFYKLNKFTPLETLHSVYYGLVYPYLSYCNIAWGTTFQSHLETLNRLQKRIIRLIHCESYLDHSEPLFRKSKILKLRDLIVYSILIYVFKNMNVFVGIDHAHSTRFSQNLRPRFRRTTLTQHSISFVGPKLWNELPAQLKCITSINSFKLLLKKFLCTEHNLSLNF